METRSSWRARRWWAWCAAALVLVGVQGCARGPELAERRVRTLLSAAELARGQGAYVRAEKRSEDLERGMSVAAVEVAMETFTAVEVLEGADGEPIEHRVKMVEGRLCIREVSEREQRWVFGYEEGPVVFVGFVVAFTRDDAGDDWAVLQLDHQPDDDCPGWDGGLT